MDLHPALRVRLNPVQHNYREFRAALVGRYHWPAADRPEQTAEAWRDVQRVLLAQIAEWIHLEPLRIPELEERLIARVGEGWYFEGQVEAVLNLLDGI